MNIHISGNFRGQTVFFLAGWPDTADVFRENLMRSMEDTYRLVGLTLPGFAQDMPFIRHYQARQAELATERAQLAKGDNTTSLFGWNRRFSDARGGTLGKAAAKNTKNTRNGVERRLLRRAPQLVTAPYGGFSFETLMDLLELAVDTAMQTHNYAPDVVVRTSQVVPSQESPYVRADDNGASRLAGEACPTHRLLPQYARPIFIAHGWGCTLLFELLLRRPHFFSRVVALDVGPSAFDNPVGYFALLSGPKLRVARSATAQTSSDGTGPASVGSATGPSATQTPTTAMSTPAGHVSPPTFPPIVNRDAEMSAFAASTVLTTGSPHTPGTPATARASAATGSPLVRPVSERRAARRRTLASRYATRATHNRPVAWRQSAPGAYAQTLQKAVVGVFHLVLVVLYAFVPTFIARFVLRLIVRLLSRPLYTYDPHLVVTAETEAVNARLRTAVGYAGSSQLPVDQTADPASPLTTFTLAESLKSGHWQILLLPFAVPSTEPTAATGGGGGASLFPWAKRSVPTCVAYQSYYFPPSTCGGDDKASSGGASGTGSGSRRDFGRRLSGGSVQSSLSRRAALRAQAQSVEPLPLMGYLYVRLWWGTVLSFLFSFTSSSRSAPSLSGASSSYTTDSMRTHPNVCTPVHADMPTDQSTVPSPLPEDVQDCFSRRHSHSPLLSQRYDIPITVPILYMYGAHKPIMRHAREFCAYVEYCKHAEDGISGVVEIKDGGHWFFADPRFRSEVSEHVWDFCQAPIS